VDTVLSKVLIKKNNDRDLTGYSAGLGYNFGSTKVDLSYCMPKEIRNKDFLVKDLRMAPALMR
jgi:hypothetical protein